MPVFPNRSGLSTQNRIPPQLPAHLLAQILALLLGAGITPANAATDACALAKAAHLTPLIGEGAHYIPLIDTQTSEARLSVCAYEGPDGKHYGLSVRESLKPSEKPAAELREDAATALRAQTGLRPQQPDIGEAALWVQKSEQLTVWLHGGRLTLTFLGDSTTPELATHLAIARKVLQALPD